MGKEITKPEIPKPKEKKENETILTEEVKNPIFFSVSEAAKIGGVNTKTIRRAIRGKQIKYKIINNRYFMDLTSIIAFLYETKKLENKLSHFGIGQYVKKWKK